MPPGLETVTRFTAAVATTSAEPATAQRVVDDFASARHDALRRRLGLASPAV